MPYAMSVIVSRALPEIDGFKPAHRKLLYTMYGMGLLKGARTKSANIVGSTMHLNPHGDAAIYDTMVRMGRGNESLLVPFVDSKGNFGKAYSRDMSCAAARYTEAKLEPVLRGAVPGYRQGDRGLCAQLRRHHHRADPAARDLPHHSGQQYPGHCSRHGLQHLLLQSGRAVRHHRGPDEGRADTISPPPCPPRISWAAARSCTMRPQMREVYENGRGSVKVRARVQCGARREYASRSPRSRPPPLWKPSWTRSPSWSRRARSKRSAICAMRPT